MRGARLSIALALAGIVLGAFSAACGSGAEPPTGIAGSVRDWGAFGGTVPAEAVEVLCLDAATGERAASTRTDESGEFFLSLPAGRYEVAYASGSRPAWVTVDVAGGEVTTLEPFVGRRGAPQASPPEARLKAILRREALALGVKKTAHLLVGGATVGAATKLFGDPGDLPAKTHVWVCVVTGDVWGSSSTMAARDLSRGGFVAYELRVGTLERLATRSSAKEWRSSDWAAPDSWGGMSGDSLW